MMNSRLSRSITTSLLVLAAAPFTLAADPAPDAAASGSKLQITITGKTPPAAAEGSQPVSNQPTPAVATANKPAATFTWKNPNGGSWTDGANWSGGEVPNGPGKEWAQYTLEKSRTVSGVEVYWLDDDGARLVPESWRVLHRQGGEWKPVEAAGAHGEEQTTISLSMNAYAWPWRSNKRELMIDVSQASLSPDVASRTPEIGPSISRMASLCICASSSTAASSKSSPMAASA